MKYDMSLLPRRLRRKKPAKKRFRQQKGRCFICNKPFEPGDFINIDHVWPSSKGGPDHWGNKVLVHEQCNQRKRDLVPSKGMLQKLMNVCKVTWPIAQANKWDPDKWLESSQKS